MRIMRALFALIFSLTLVTAGYAQSRTQQVEFLLNGVRDDANAPVASGFVYAYVAGTTTDKTIYSAYDKSSSFAQPIPLDAYGRATAFGLGCYKFVIKTSALVTVQTLDNLCYGQDDASQGFAGAAGGTANAITATPAPAFPALTNGIEVSLLAIATNTSTTPTLAVSGLTAKTIVRPDGTALVAGDIKNGTHYTFRYYSSSDKWVLLEPSLWRLVYRAGTVTGTANALVASTTPTFLALADGAQVVFEATAANTGAATINVNSLGAIDLNAADDTALEASEIVSGFTYVAQYEASTNAWLLLTPSYAAGSYTPTLFNTTNVAASTAFLCQYFRIGDVANVSCKVNVDPTAGAPTATQLGVSLPIASNMTVPENLAGACASIDSTTDRAVGIIGDETNDRAVIQWATADTTNHTLTCNFTYVIK